MTVWVDGTAAPASPEVEIDAEARRGAWRAAMRTREGIVGLVVIVVICGVIFIGPHVAPFEPDATAVGRPVARPSWDHWLGTDQLGRDVWSRFLSGGTSVLLPPFLVVLVAYAVGGGLGILAAFRGGIVDSVIARSFDVLLALPALLMVLVIIAGLGDSMIVLVLTVAFVYIPRVGRVVRGATQAVVSNDYIAAARVRGENTRSIIVGEIVPNLAGPVVADAALRLTFSIIFLSTLNFLGIGTAPPSSAWGLMVAESRGLMRVNPWPTIAPAIGIALITIGSNLLADALARHATRQSNEQAVL